MKISWKMKTAAAVAGVGLAFGAASASAMPSGEAAEARPQISQQAAPAPPEAAPQALPCGFSFGNQSYKNCGSSDILVVAPAHESATGQWFEYQYCLEPGESRQPLANWGMLVYLATHIETNC